MVSQFSKLETHLDYQSFPILVDIKIAHNFFFYCLLG